MELKRLERPAPAAVMMFDELVVGVLLKVEATVLGSLFFGDAVDIGSI